MLTLTSKALIPAEELTVTCFVTCPIFPARFTVTVITPFVPGARCHGCDGSFATVQPQDVVTLLMMTSWSETFVRLKLNGAIISPGLELYSLESASKTKAGFGDAAGGTLCSGTEARV